MVAVCVTGDGPELVHCNGVSHGTMETVVQLETQVVEKADACWPKPGASLRGITDSARTLATLNRRAA